MRCFVWKWGIEIRFVVKNVCVNQKLSFTIYSGFILSTHRSHISNSCLTPSISPVAAINSNNEHQGPFHKVDTRW
jgi:hypothetical protein